MTYEMALQDARYDGRSEGIAIGERHGIAEGEERKAIEAVRNFLAMGLSIEQVAQGRGFR